jgi:aminopeptidase N
VDGRATYAVARVAAGDLVLHADGPVVTDLRVDGAVAVWSRTGDAVRVRDVPDHATVDVAWTADGPWREDGGLVWGDVVYSFHEPDMARRWLVIHDVPRDKFPLRWEITVPQDLVVAANGMLASQDDAAPGWRTWRWRIEEPVPAYLAAFHAGPYVVLGDLGTAELPVIAWALPGSEIAARATFGRTAEMVTVFEPWFGPYPFTHYGTALADFPGGMEHTTVTTFSAALAGQPLGELVHAHELAHHWWGNDVTLAAWDDIWLNEGFASYAEALWQEHLHGHEGLVSYVRGFAQRYRASVLLGDSFAVVDPDDLWSATVYDKGALVLHALRYRLGDDAFGTLLRRWEAGHRYDTADTDAFRALAEDVAGAPLDDFLVPMLFEAGESVWTPGWGAAEGQGGWTLALQVAQDRPHWSMPLPVRVTLEDGSSVSLTLQVEGPVTRATRCLPRRPVAVAWDPDAWMAVMPRAEAHVLTPWVDACAPAAEEGTNAPASAGQERGWGCGVRPGASGPLAATVLGLAVCLLRRAPALRNRRRARGEASCAPLGGVP